MAALPQEALKQLKVFITLLKANSDILHANELSFFREYLESLGAKIPPKKEQPKAEAPPQQEHTEQHQPKEHQQHHEPKPQPAPEPKHEQPPPQAEEVEEPEPEDPHLWKADEDHESLFLGDANKSPSEEDMEAANDLLQEGRAAAREGNYAGAIEKLTEAIRRNPTQSNLYAFRSEFLVHQKRPNAAIRDADKALQLNPDSARALKTRGKAKRYLGKYLEAFYDLSQGNTLDWDENTAEIIKEIKERADRAKLKQRKEDEKQRLDQLKREAAEKRRRQQEAEAAQAQAETGGFGGLEDILFQDPEVKRIVQNNPAILQKIVKALSGDAQAASDPDVQKVLERLQASFGAPGGFGGAPPGGAHPGGHQHAHPGGHQHAHPGGHQHAHPPGQAHSHTTPKKPDDDLD